MCPKGTAVGWDAKPATATAAAAVMLMGSMQLLKSQTAEDKLMMH
jgi:hypothetical protein